MSEWVPGVGAVLRRCGIVTADRIRSAVIAEAGDHRRDGMVRVPGVARCIAGTR